MEVRKRKKGDLAIIRYKDEPPRYVIFLGYYTEVYKKAFRYWINEGDLGPPVFLEQMISGEWVFMSRQYDKRYLNVEWLG